MKRNHSSPSVDRTPVRLRDGYPLVATIMKKESGDNYAAFDVSTVKDLSLEELGY